MPEGFTLVLIVVLGLAIAFDYINGFHDTANAIATSVSTRALRPGWAIAMSATANFVGALTGTAVAQTVGSGLVEIGTGVQSQTVIAAALVGAIAWNLLTWRLGIPSSSSHALIGGLLGSAVAAYGVGAWQIDGIVGKVLVPLVGSPLVGFTIGLLLMALLFNVFRRAHPVRLNGVFRRLQVISAGYMAFSHGSNDAQKTMGIMTLALVVAGVIDSFVVPLWVILTAAAAISLGTAAGGWRIIKTMGHEGREARSGPRLRRRDHGRIHHLRGVPARDAGQHDARHQLGDHGRGLLGPPQDGALGRGAQHRRGVGPDPPRLRAGGGGHLPAPSPDPRLTLPLTEP
jgi:PiT family inorganic phosphate transporter